MLETHNAALCWADRRGRPVTPLWRTADWGYLRLHEGRAKPWPRYGRTALGPGPSGCRTYADDVLRLLQQRPDGGPAGRRHVQPAGPPGRARRYIG